METIYPGVRLVLTDPMPAEAVEIAHKQVLSAAEDLDGNSVATLVLEMAGAWGVPAVWEQVCRPLLARLPGRTAAEVVVEHALCEGLRVGLDAYRREPGRALPTGGVLLAGVEREAHSLGVQALAAALREKGRGCLNLGPALPWSALTDAVRRARPHTVVLWSQTPVTGRAYRLVRFARDFPRLRVYGAGPGWIEPLTPPAAHLDSLSDAVAVCSAVPAGRDAHHIRYGSVPYR
ncbi:transcriptional regulator [Micromonospora sp. WMMD1155]|uniref:transcriptional regulator n=1 Tax=Micromonospora sp. WMMD1155 TaxID=3016094 RepID=UPI00249C18CC|nr:transcriptional regulator [Micromonospora sp. WMMD1155]WFE49033.1 transcriptional regulator [Micromonospora sp. WMMD1155]